MAASIGRNSVIKYDNRSGTLTDLTTTKSVTKVGFKMSSSSAEATAIGHKGAVRLAGINDASLDMEGHWNTTIADILDAGLTQQKSFEWDPQGTASGTVKYTGEMLMSSYKLQISFDGPITWSSSSEQYSAVTRGNN